MNILCTICGREGSKGLKNKNLKKLRNKPLIMHTIDHAKKTKLFSEIVVSTDSKKIQNIAIKSGVYSWFLRSKKLSSSRSPKIPVIKDALIRAENKFKKKYEFIIDLDITSPLRKPNDILKAFKILKLKRYNNLFSVCESKKNPYFNMIEIKNKKISICKISKKNFFSRQEAPKVYSLNASIYIWRRNYLLNKDSKLINSKTGIYIMPESSIFDIDTALDFKIVKAIFNEKK